MSETKRVRRSGLGQRNSGSGSGVSNSANTIGILGYTQAEGKDVVGKNKTAIAKSLGAEDWKDVSADLIQSSGCQYATVITVEPMTAYSASGPVSVPAGTNIVVVFPKAADGKNRTPDTFSIENVQGSQKPMEDSAFGEDPEKPGESILIGEGSNIKLEQLSLNVDSTGQVIGVCNRAFAGMSPDERWKPAKESIAAYGKLMAELDPEAPLPTVSELEAAGIKMVRTGFTDANSYVAVEKANKPHDGKTRQWLTAISKTDGHTKLETIDDLKKAMQEVIDIRSEEGRSCKGKLSLKAVLAMRDDDPSDPFSRVPMNILTNIPLEKDADFHQATPDEIIEHILKTPESLEAEFVQALIDGRAFGVAVQARTVELMASLTPGGDHGTDLFRLPYDPPEGDDNSEGAIGFNSDVIVEGSQFRTGYTLIDDPKNPGTKISKDVRVSPDGRMEVRGGLSQNPPTFTDAEGVEHIGITDLLPRITSVVYPGSSFDDPRVLKATLSVVQESLRGDESPEELHRIRAEATKKALQSVKISGSSPKPFTHLSDIPLVGMPEVMYEATKKTNDDLCASYTTYVNGLKEELDRVAPYMRPESANNRSRSPSR